jgi:hypothetical protein
VPIGKTPVDPTSFEAAGAAAAAVSTHDGSAGAHATRMAAVGQKAQAITGTPASRQALTSAAHSGYVLSKTSAAGVTLPDIGDSTKLAAVIAASAGPFRFLNTSGLELTINAYGTDVISLRGVDYSSVTTANKGDMLVIQPIAAGQWIAVPSSAAA